ncbi:MAG: AAA family ATPase [Bacteroidota bacterium]
MNLIGLIFTPLVQVGKTTLFNKLLEGKDYLFLNGDDPAVRKLLSNPNLEQLKNIIGKHFIVFIDEAQRIENIGVTLKLIRLATMNYLKCWELIRKP